MSEGHEPVENSRGGLRTAKPSPPPLFLPATASLTPAKAGPCCPVQGLPAVPTQPVQARCIYPLSSSYVFYKYIVVVVEGAPACGQPGFSQAPRALAWPPSLCTTPCSRCCGNGDKSHAGPRHVDNSPVVPKLSPVLRTGRLIHRVSFKSALCALQTSADSY